MQARVVWKKRMGDYVRLCLEQPHIARLAKPGQFVAVAARGDQAPFWRRPFSICRVADGVIELFIKPIGPGSRLVAESERDQPLEILGPLGRPFTHFGKAPVLLVGGGYGAAPLLFLAERYQAKKAGSRVKLLFGGRCQTDLVLLRDFKQQGIALACATEDGSHGQSGRVTALLEAELSKAKVPPVIQAAGPWGMLQAVAGLAARFHCQAEVSVEETMACGLGICNGCAVSVAGKYQRACQDGPVFPADQVNWEARHGH